MGGVFSFWMVGGMLEAVYNNKRVRKVTDIGIMTFLSLTRAPVWRVTYLISEWPRQASGPAPTLLEQLSSIATPQHQELTIITSETAESDTPTAS